MTKIHYVNLWKSVKTYHEDGQLKDFTIRAIKHRASYIQWNDKTNKWDTINISCNCEVCQENKPQWAQLKLF